MRRWITLLPLAVLGLLAVLFAGYALHHDPHVTPAALVGKPLPAHTLPTLADGAPTDLRATVQGPTLINVFASWCAPCIQEAPALMALKAEGARVVGVSYKDEPGRTSAFLARYGNPFVTVLVDKDGAAGLDLGVSGVPETYLVSADGRVLAKHAGQLEPADAEAMLRTAAAGR